MTKIRLNSFASPSVKPDRVDRLSRSLAMDVSPHEVG
jgi:hypothetical protein